MKPQYKCKSYQAYLGPAENGMYAYGDRSSLFSTVNRSGSNDCGKNRLSITEMNLLNRLRVYLTATLNKLQKCNTVKLVYETPSQLRFKNCSATSLAESVVQGLALICNKNNMFKNNFPFTSQTLAKSPFLFQRKVNNYLNC